MKWNPEDEIEFIVRKLNHELTTAEERQFQCCGCRLAGADAGAGNCADSAAG